ncbi:MAG TPA: TatD family hydrolase [Gemmatimonadales bacterium]|nr:TatD family hydrolase [Gemmatimonadales bacterium]
MLVDTHCHLADPAYEADRDAVLERAGTAGLGHIVAIGETPERAEAAVALARSTPGISASAGLHPHDARHWSEDRARWLEDAATWSEVVAIGETGLDYHYDFSPRAAQRLAFEAQMDLAARAGRPAIIHAREADDDVLSVLRNHPGATAILHSFSSGPELCRGAIALGHYVSWSGMITFRNWSQDELIREVPHDRLLVETDGPYLAPVPMRGKRNEPAYVRHTAERLAQVVGWTVGECITRTAENAVRVFGPRVVDSRLLTPP